MALYVFVMQRLSCLHLHLGHNTQPADPAVWPLHREPPPLLGETHMTHTPLHQQGFFSISVWPEHKLFKRPLICVDSLRGPI